MAKNIEQVLSDTNLFIALQQGQVTTFVEKYDLAIPALPIGILFYLGIQHLCRDYYENASIPPEARRNITIGSVLIGFAAGMISEILLG